VTTLFASLANARDVKAIYHATRGINIIAAALSSVQDHLDADPKVKIDVVTNGAGIDFLLNGAKDAKGRGFSGSVGDLASQGAVFRVSQKLPDCRPKSVLSPSSLNAVTDWPSSTDQTYSGSDLLAISWHTASQIDTMRWSTIR
jgi:hypothetical protein